MESQKMKAQIKGIKNKPLLFISALRPLELGIKSSGVNKLELWNFSCKMPPAKLEAYVQKKKAESGVAYLPGPCSWALKLSGW